MTRDELRNEADQVAKSINADWSARDGNAIVELAEKYASDVEPATVYPPPGRGVVFRDMNGQYRWEQLIAERDALKAQLAVAQAEVKAEHAEANGYRETMKIGALECARLRAQLDRQAAVMRNEALTLRHRYGSYSGVKEEWLDNSAARLEAALAPERVDETPKTEHVESCNATCGSYACVLDAGHPSLHSANRSFTQSLPFWSDTSHMAKPHEPEQAKHEYWDAATRQYMRDDNSRLERERDAAQRIADDAIAQVLILTKERDAARDEAVAILGRTIKERDDAAYAGSIALSEAQTLTKELDATRAMHRETVKRLTEQRDDAYKQRNRLQDDVDAARAEAEKLRETIAELEKIRRRLITLTRVRESEVFHSARIDELRRRRKHLLQVAGVKP